MTFEKIPKAPTTGEINNLKRKLRKLEKDYENSKYQFIDLIEHDDISKVSTDDFLSLKELEIEQRQLFWKIHELEHPEDTATREAYRFLNSMPSSESIDFLIQESLTTHELIERIRENPDYLSEVTV